MILIPTYNRPSMLARMLRQIKAQTGERIIIVDDGSTKDYSEPKSLLWAKDKFVRFSENNGKKNYYRVVNQLFSQARCFMQKGDSPEYIYKLDDDLWIEPGAFEQSKKIFGAITHRSKQVLRLLKDDRTGKASWGSAPDRYEDGIWKAGWIDMVWMCSPDYLKGFEWEMPGMYFKDKQAVGFWEEYPNRSSQVGKWLTHNTWEDGKFWAVDDLLFIHQGQQSKMNPAERKINPL